MELSPADANFFLGVGVVVAANERT